VGVPQVGALETAPKFHTVGSDSLVLTGMVKNLLAVLHPENGSFTTNYLHIVITTLSSTGGAPLRSFEASRGQLIAERKLHSQAEVVSFQSQ
ncbi:hypothetical protein M378DRAFT_82335, partial [Amanita muscaria Koide BX008]